MSTIKTPVGPKSRGVYMRRRILVLAGLLAVVAVIVLIIVRPGSASPETGAKGVNVPADLQQAEQNSTTGVDPTKATECGAGELDVKPITDTSNYGPGEMPQLSLSVTNTSDSECTADLGTAGMTFEISSGDDQVWRSRDCQKSPDSRLVILQAGETLETEPIEWDRTRSSTETCDIERDPVVADGASYHLRVSAANVPGTGTVQFLLY